MKDREAPGFLAGIEAPFSALGFLLRTPSAWFAAAVPVVVASVLIVLLGAIAVTFVPREVGVALPTGHAWYATLLRGTAETLAALAALIVAIAAAALLSQPLSAPALEHLVRLRERSLGVPQLEKAAFLTDLGRSARSALLGCSCLPFLAILFVIEIAFPGSSIVVIPIKVFVTGIFVSWDLLDYPLSRRDLGLRERIAFLSTHKAMALGFGCALATIFLVPCAQLLLLPVGVVAAAGLVHRAERAVDRPPP